MNKKRLLGIALTMVLSCMSLAKVNAITPKFAKVHKEKIQLNKENVFKKTLFLCGLINAAYLGVNDLVAALQLNENQNSVEGLQAQLLAVKVGLIEKPFLIRYIAEELEFCEKYPNFPLGFNDSAEGPERLSVEFLKIADHMERLPINHEAKDIKALRKEAEKVVFELFWTDGEKMRTMCIDLANFIRRELKEDLPLNIFTKPIKPVKK